MISQITLSFANLSFANSTYNFTDKTFANFPKSLFLGTKTFANDNEFVKKSIVIQIEYLSNVISILLYIYENVQLTMML